MFIHLGNETLIKTQDVIGIFDLESTTISKHTRKYLSLAEKKGDVVTVSYELPKSFVLCAEKSGKNRKIYISQISSTTLVKRSGYIESLND